MINNLPTNLRKLRDSHGMSCFELSMDIQQEMDYEILPTSLNKYENGVNSPNLNTLTVLADYYGITLDQLVR